MDKVYVPPQVIEMRVLASEAKMNLDKANKILERELKKGNIHFQPERNIDLAGETAYTAALRFAGELRRIEQYYRNISRAHQSEGGE